MKLCRLPAALLFVTLLCLPLSVRGDSRPKDQPSFSPCVGCGFRGDCRTCTGGGYALYCYTFNCGACQESGTCSGGGGEMESKKVTPDSKQSLKTLKISSRVIRDIATKHARFAITIAEMSVYGISPGEQRVFWTPVKLAPSDVEAFLNKATHSRFFRQYDKDVRRLNRLIQEGKLSDIVYAISVKQTEEGSWSIKIQTDGERAATSGDPAYSTLDIQVKVSQTTLGQQSSRKQITWQIQ